MFPRLAAIGLIVLVWAPAAQAWHTTAPAYPPPPVPRCEDVVARHGQQGIWVGHFSGKYRGPVPGSATAYGARGCFLSERACRAWLQENLSFAGYPLHTMSCRPASGRIAY